MRTLIGTNYTLKNELVGTAHMLGNITVTVVLPKGTVVDEVYDEGNRWLVVTRFLVSEKFHDAGLVVHAYVSKEKYENQE